MPNIEDGNTSDEGGISCRPHLFSACMLFAVVLLAAGAARLDAQVVINEMLAANKGASVDDDGDSSDWIELVNLGAAPVDLGGFSVSDNASNLSKWVMPPVMLAPSEHLLLWCSGKDRTSASGEALAEAAFSPSLVSLDAQWRYLTGEPDDTGPPADWMMPGFDDAPWPTGRPGFGFGDDDDRTILPRGITAAFLRHSFTLDEAIRLQNLILQVRYDDGFVMYLNGQQVLAVNFPDGQAPTFASRSTASSEADSDDRFDLSEFLPLLQPGENVVAMALLNYTVGSNDLTLIPELGTVAGTLHTNFSLDAGGEQVILSAPDGTIADSIRFPKQYTDQSWARSPDGEGPFLYHLTPTPGAANQGRSSVEPLVVADTEFSVDRGIYDEPFEVAITTATENAVIRYTLDGTAPTESHGHIYENPITVNDTTTLRAIAHAPDLRSSNVDAQTYIFFETPEGGGVLNQPQLPPGYPSVWSGVSGSRQADYGMDPRVATDTGSAYYDPGVAEGLRALPILSLVMDKDHLFSSEEGIYANPLSRGPDWEKPVSVEFFFPDGRTGFQVTAGLQMQGNASRRLTRPKHNMRLLFKSIYGPSRLRYRFFDDSPLEDFNTLILRGCNGDSWIHPTETQQRRAQYIRDQWHRDTQAAMGQPTGHQRHVNLYLNGLYWGLYHVFERPDAEFHASYFGGEPSEYDAINTGQAEDGDLNAWNDLVNMTQAGVSTAAAYEQVRQRLDVVNLIDYLLINFYSGNVDWDHHNWYGGARRSGGQFRFYCWDGERTFWDTGSNRVTLNNVGHPTGLHQRLKQNAEYRLLFADRVHAHFFNDGGLTPESVEATWLALADEIAPVLSAEAARFGDHHRPSAPYTRDREWRTERNSLQAGWFRNRTNTVFQQIRSAGLYPAVAAPLFNQHGGMVDKGFELRISNQTGTVFYTLDGTDPRLPGGETSPGALEATAAPVIISHSAEVKARARSGSTWSALTEAVFIVMGTDKLRITEIMYHPADPPEGSIFDDNDLEFIEIFNAGDQVIDLSGATFAEAIQYTFPQGSKLMPGEYLCIARNMTGFESRYETAGLPIVGDYDGSLDNIGERILLFGPLGELLLDLTYDDLWYPETDGQGYSLVPIDPFDEEADWSSAASWRPSTRPHGSPGQADPTEEGGWQRIGDANQDAKLDLSDAIQLLQFLFTGETDTLPCGGESIDEGGTLVVLDVNGDTSLDLADAIYLLTYLFGDGDPPAGEGGCQWVEGCPSLCQ